MISDAEIEVKGLWYRLRQPQPARSAWSVKAMRGGVQA